MYILLLSVDPSSILDDLPSPDFLNFFEQKVQNLLLQLRILNGTDFAVRTLYPPFISASARAVVIFRTQATGEAFLAENKVWKEWKELIVDRRNRVNLGFSETGENIRFRFRENLWPETGTGVTGGSSQRPNRMPSKKRRESEGRRTSGASMNKRERGAFVQVAGLDMGRFGMSSSYHVAWSWRGLGARLVTDPYKKCIVIQLPTFYDEPDEMDLSSIPQRLDSTSCPEIILRLQYPAAISEVYILGNDRPITQARLLSIDEKHERVAPFVGVLPRLVSYDLRDRDLVLERLRDCDVLVLDPLPKIPVRTTASLYEKDTLERLDRWFADHDMRIAFQLDALLRNGTVDAKLLDALQPGIDDVIDRCGTAAAEKTLVAFAESLIEARHR